MDTTSRTYPSAQLAINLLNAALFHDTGYIQEKSDDEGTGAKYTSIHVKRSIQFLDKHQAAFKLIRIKL